MVKYRILSVIMTVMLVFLVTSCGKELPTKAVYDLSKEPVSLDPQSATDEASFIVINNIFEGLLTIDESGNLTEGLAEEYSVSSDGLTYHFKLRSGQKWSNGYDLTANDFLFAFQRLFDPATRSQTRSSFYCIKNSQAIAEGGAGMESLGVTVLSDTELTIELGYANSMFLQLLTTAPAMPCNEQFFVEAKGTYGLEANSVLSSGPFSLYSWGHDQDGYLKLEKNENYYGKQDMKLNYVTLWTDVEPEELLPRFLEETTHAYYFTGQADKSLTKSNVANLEKEENTVWGLWINNQHPQLSNHNLRLAFAQAFDRTRYQDVLPDFLSVADTLIPPSAMLDGKSYREQATVSAPVFDLGGAQASFQAAQAELGGVGIENLTVLIPEDEAISHNRYFDYLSQTIQREFNLFIAVETVSQKDLENRMKAGDYAMAIQPVRASYQHPMAVLNQFSSRNENSFYSYQNPDYNSYVDKILLETSGQEVLQNCIAAEQLLLNDAIVLPLYYQSDYLATNAATKGITLNPQNGYITFRYGSFVK